MFLGPDTGALNRTKSFQRITPLSTRSPFLVQGDIGFFSYKNKVFGKFLVMVQTYTKRIFACFLRNSQAATIIEALKLMLKVNFSCHLIATFFIA